MRYPDEYIDDFRRNAGELENEVIDEYRAGRMTRKELLQRGSVLGMSIPFLPTCSTRSAAAWSRTRMW